jgi:hypothetical protein
VQDKRYNKSMDATTQECVIDEQIEEAYQCLLPYKDRIIGLGEGNHERVIANMGTNPIQRLCNKLGCDYLGYTFMCSIILRENNGRGRTVTIYGNHGWGGGTRTEGGDLTKYAKVMQSYESDIYLFGHTHGLVSKRSPRFSLIGKKLMAKDRFLCVCGTFLKTISPDSIPSWSETRGFHPARIGGIDISIKPNHEWCDIKVHS